MSKIQCYPARLAKGASLLEVLVAVLVLAVGLLGVAALQATALRNNQSSYERSEAVILSYAMFDVLRANRAAAIAGDYNLAEWTCAVPTAGTRADNERRRWMQAMQRSLGSTACGSVACMNEELCIVGLRWDDARGTGDRTAARTYSIETRTRL
ncbi:type IV pilus modification protein PilV [Lysobacter sp. LF1]|uniref:Type IV pilus modification protein PilV n=1 Tax=Lysobacter stagni TaxID=3045172 RepID=A0ABT6XID5_9GAMM|nr:type IV pilus modification protein PilV [Lysobacter sp. LF1]MDI9239897.1 type IV pilus modification protein PilV [Lysobacter sp. LF1]